MEICSSSMEAASYSLVSVSVSSVGGTGTEPAIPLMWRCVTSARKKIRLPKDSSLKIQFSTLSACLGRSRKKSISREANNSLRMERAILLSSDFLQR